ncbi:MAG: DUF962 domain-containing protein [Acidobacteriota bacterium]|nr:DUF962 domain-containing protein [Acidobacteriota bacterium]
MADHRITSFADFWPHYVAEHSRPATRMLHAVGTLAGTTLITVFLLSGRWYLTPLAFIPGYGLAWVAHFFIEHNRPASFKYPRWSFLADYKMVALMLTGRMTEEVKRARTHKQPPGV